MPGGVGSGQPAQVVDLAGGPQLTQRLLLALGVVSIATAAAFLWAPTNYKRMLAYSSIEHVGVVCLGLGFGGLAGVGGAVLHVANHALAKSALFVLSGRIRAAPRPLRAGWKVEGGLAPRCYSFGFRPTLRISSIHGNPRCVIVRWECACTVTCNIASPSLQQGIVRIGWPALIGGEKKG